jgi:hypothetical protein
MTNIPTVNNHNVIMPYLVLPLHRYAQLFLKQSINKADMNLAEKKSLGFANTQIHLAVLSSIIDVINLLAECCSNGTAGTYLVGVCTFMLLEKFPQFPRMHIVTRKGQK